MTPRVQGPAKSGDPLLAPRERRQLTAQEILRHQVPRRSGLSIREWEVAVLSARGLGTGAIAAQLSLSPHTVKSHLQRTFTHLGVGNRVALTALLYRNGWLPADLAEDGECVVLSRELLEAMTQLADLAARGRFAQAQQLGTSICRQLPQPRRARGAP